MKKEYQFVMLVIEKFHMTNAHSVRFACMYIVWEKKFSPPYASHHSYWLTVLMSTPRPDSESSRSAARPWSMSSDSHGRWWPPSMLMLPATQDINWREAYNTHTHRDTSKFLLHKSSFVGPRWTRVSFTGVAAARGSVWYCTCLAYWHSCTLLLAPNHIFRNVSVCKPLLKSLINPSRGTIKTKTIQTTIKQEK